MRRSLLLLALSLVGLVPAPSLAQPSPVCDKGPVGWDVYRHLELLPMIRCGVESHQFSSYKRDGLNGDGETQWACFRTDPQDGCVIAEATGAGEIDSIWFTRDRGNVTGNGRIRIDLDGIRVLDSSLQDVVDSELGAPFVFPLVANADQSSGGSVIKVPMPFRSSMRVSIDTTRYFHVTWRSFADAVGVTTFDPSDPALDIVEQWKAWGTRDPKGAFEDGYLLSMPHVQVAPHETTLPGLGGPPRMITGFSLRPIFNDTRAIRPIPQVWEETPILAHEITREGTGNDYYPNYIPDQTVHALDQVLADSHLIMEFDGVRTVDVPIAEFFGAGTGRADVRTLMSRMTEDNDALVSWWPMPVRSNVRIGVENRSDQLFQFELEISYVPLPELAEAFDAGRVGYFHATSRGQVTELGRDYNFLDAPGTGHVVGVNHTIYPGPYKDPIADPYAWGEHLGNGVIRTSLEGDERIHTDGSRTPQLYGTGNEDFYEGAWYYNRSVFSNPLNGNPLHEQSIDGCEVGCTGAYRLFVADALSFEDGISMGIEVGGHNDEVRTMTSTTLWYGGLDAGLTTTDQLDIGDLASEAAHGYSGTGASTTLTSSFDGDDDDVLLTDTARDELDAFEMTFTIDPANRGVRLRRTSDQMLGGQAAVVRVDGSLAGTWIAPLRNPFHRWRDDTFELPASLTAGRAQVIVRLEPLPGSPPWSAARYEARSRR